MLPLFCNVGANRWKDLLFSVYFVVFPVFTVVLFEHQSSQASTVFCCVSASGEGSSGGTGGHPGVYQEAGGEKTDENRGGT